MTSIDLSAALAETTSSQSKTIEHRSEPRFLVRWYAVVVLDDHVSFRGFIKDISLKGASLFIDRNLEKEGTLQLQIQIPALDDRVGPQLIEVAGKIVYAIHDNDERLFRLGILFTRFKGQSGQTYLGSRLENHQAISMGS